MKILVYGDSNTWGYVPNVNGYSKDCKQYPAEHIWWYPLTKQYNVVVNALCGRAINNENKWLDGRNCTETIEKDLAKYENIDLIILQLGTNDCKVEYNLTPKYIIEDLENLIDKISKVSPAEILIISPPKILENNPHTQKYYLGATFKTRVLNTRYQKLANEKNIHFVSGLNAEVGEDGEHLSILGHEQLGKAVLEYVNTLQKEKTQHQQDLSK